MVKRARGWGAGSPSRWRCNSSSISPRDTETLRQSQLVQQQDVGNSKQEL
jgi:hypothetical protein